MEKGALRAQVDQLLGLLQGITAKDQEQEVRGIALPVLDEILVQAREMFRDHPIIQRLYEVVSVETIREGEPVRAVDALQAVGAINAALGPKPASVSVPRGRLDSHQGRG
jgi:hypothetical protein